MDIWTPLSILFILLSFAAQIIRSNMAKKKKYKLPPGPQSIPIVSTLRWLNKSLADINDTFRELQLTYGSIVTLRIASCTAILIADHDFAHKVLVQSGSAFADRPPVSKVRSELLGPNLITHAPYGQAWHVLRGNLSSKLLHPSRLKHFAEARKWALQIFVGTLKHQAEAGGNGIVVANLSFQNAVYRLMLLMCFGKKMVEEEAEEIKSLLKSLESGLAKANVLAFCPKITKLVFQRKWNALLEIRQKILQTFVPLIRAREGKNEEDPLHPYVDSLLELEIPEEGGRRLSENEMVSLCTEFLLVGAGTTYTTLEWIMAGIVAHQEVQKKIRKEIESVVANDKKINEDDLLNMPYVKAVVMEGLRRYPLSHFGAPHAATRDGMEIDGYVVPKDALILFMLAEMSLDGKVWEEPMEFRPERFLEGGGGEGTDVMGNREVKMIPFGAGRRMCPGSGLAMLHLQLFVARLVQEFEWEVVDGEEVDFSAKWDNSLAMKNPLRARITLRRKKDVI